MALMHVDFFSSVLGMCCQMDVIIPQKAEGQIGMAAASSAGPYPTLYLLHGYSDNHTIWQRRTSIERYVADMGLAVVMPCVHLSFYTDMKHGQKYWTFVSHELPEICRGFFHLSDKREDTFAAGLSMGGYGAVKLALGAPDVFCAGASLSGAVDLAQAGPKEWRWDDIYGGYDAFKGSDDDTMALLAKLKASGKPLPALYQWCGTGDFLYAQNLAFRDEARRLGYELTYEDGPGDHQWAYWDNKIQNVLKWLPLKQ